MMHQIEYTTPDGLHHRFEFEITGVEAAYMADPHSFGSVRDERAFTSRLVDAFRSQIDLTIRTRVVKHVATYAPGKR